MSMNLKLFAEVQETIDRDRRHWNQASFVVFEGESDENPSGTAYGVEGALEPNLCGTTMCFAGHATVLNEPRGDVKINYRSGEFFVRGKSVGSTEEHAAEILGLDSERAHELFYCFTSDPEVIRDLWMGWVAEDALAAALSE